MNQQGLWEAGCAVTRVCGAPEDGRTRWGDAAGWQGGEPVELSPGGRAGPVRGEQGQAVGAGAGLRGSTAPGQHVQALPHREQTFLVKCQLIHSLGFDNQVATSRVACQFVYNKRHKFSYFYR